VSVLRYPVTSVPKVSVARGHPGSLVWRSALVKAITSFVNWPIWLPKSTPVPVSTGAANTLMVNAAFAEKGARSAKVASDTEARKVRKVGLRDRSDYWSTAGRVHLPRRPSICIGSSRFVEFW